MAAPPRVLHRKRIDIEDSEEAAAAGELLPSDWLDDHVLEGVAGLDSPAFVNEPTAPTPPLGDTSQRVANMEALHQALLAPSIVFTAVEFADSPYQVKFDDSVLYVDSSGGPVEIDLLPAATREGRPITIKDVAAGAVVNNITIVPNGVETIEGLANLPIVANYGGFRLYPATAKYVIAP